jgi:hypothetical protein
MTKDNIHSLFITQVFPQAIRSKNKKRIILVQRMSNNRWSGRQERHVHGFRKSEFWIYWFSVKLRMFHINIAYRSRNLHQIESWFLMKKENGKSEDMVMEIKRSTIYSKQSKAKKEPPESEFFKKI